MINERHAAIPSFYKSTRKCPDCGSFDRYKYKNEHSCAYCYPIENELAISSPSQQAIKLGMENAIKAKKSKYAKSMPVVMRGWRGGS